MSSASNGGYSGTLPNSNINTRMVNSTNSNYSAGMGSTRIPQSAFSVRGASNNVDAAAAKLSGGGGTKYYKLLKRKIKNITRRYKMPKKSKRRRITRMKRKIRRSSRKRMRGGSYGQLGTNVAQSANYSVGGLLNAGSLGMANPPPIQVSRGECSSHANHYYSK